MIKDTVAPIPIEELKEYFNDDSIIFNIDYAESTLKKDKLLTYISNLEIPVKLSGFYKLQYTEKEEFILSYMNSKLIVNLEEIENTILYILLVTLGFEKARDDVDLYITDVNAHFEGTQYSGLFFNKDELLNFIKNNKEVINRWIISIASASIYNITTIKDSDGSSFFNPENEFKILDDYDYVGVNYVKLFAHEKTQMILAYEGCPIYYMKKQFEEYMFKGNNMYHYYMHRNNFMALYTLGIASGFVKRQEFYDCIEKDLEKII